MNEGYKIIVARYNEDIDWLASEMHNCIIYNKGEKLGLSNEICLPNVGRESETYLNYIISNYENLPDTIIFTQANITDHIQFPFRRKRRLIRKISSNTLSESEKQKITTCKINHLNTIRKEAEQSGISTGSLIKKSKSFRTISDWISENQEDWTPWKSLKSQISYLNDERISFKDWFEKNLNQKFPKNEIIVHMHGIFAVQKSLILKNDLNFYKNLIKKVNYNINPIEGHFFERSWHYIFNQKSDIIYKNGCCLSRNNIIT